MANGNFPLTRTVTHEQKNQGGNSGTEHTHGCGNPTANQFHSIESPRKAALSNLHTHEATGSSPVVSVKNHRNRLIPVIFFIICNLFGCLIFAVSPRLTRWPTRGKVRKVPALFFSAYLLADDAADGFQNFIMRPSKGVRVIHGSGLG